MGKYVSVDILKKASTCKGVYLYVDSDVKVINSESQAKKLINEDDFKLQLRTKIDNVTGKKVFTFTKGLKNGTLYNQPKKTFTKALEYVSSKREDVREVLKLHGTLIEKKEVPDSETFLEEQDTFFDKMKYFLETKAISARPSTIQNYSTALKNHSEPLHKMKINDITLEDVQRIVNTMLEDKADATVVLYARTLGAFLKSQKANVSKELENLSLPQVDNKVDYTLNLYDTKRIIQAMRGYSGTTVDNEIFYSFEEIKNIFAFSLTGRRINEILNLKYTDINFQANTFKIPAITTKGKKELVFNLDDYLLEAIHSQAKLNNVDLTKTLTDKRLFKYTKETPRVHFQNLLKALGLPRLRLHDIRHMLASTLVQNKVPIADISVMLGHSSIAITEARYASKHKDQASRATNALNDLMEGL